jgi:hypothetical protein
MPDILLLLLLLLVLLLIRDIHDTRRIKAAAADIHKTDG